MVTTISSQGKVLIPAGIRRQDDIQAGQEFEIERLEAGHYRIVRRNAAPKTGLVDLLLACPVKGYFVPIESESTDTL